MAKFENRLPVGPGSRGGTFHLPGKRNEYMRAWKAAHPEYREREKLRRARERATDSGRDPADILVASTFPRALPSPAEFCLCDCGCREAVVTVCGFCRDGMHQEELS